MASKKILQLAFNDSFFDFTRLIGKIPKSSSVYIEAGTPLIKKEGIKVVSAMHSFWPGVIVADLKIVDGAKDEVIAAKSAGADIVTVLGTSSPETLKIFVNTCSQMQIKSAVDMINVKNPLKVLWQANTTPDIVYIHRGRDEENSFGKVIQYKEISKIKSKWDITVGAAGGIDQKEMRSALFNGADIVVVNVVSSEVSWKGIKDDHHFETNLSDFLRSISN